ncbi:hypothetical protein NEOKW01_1334 [Nematocida sp. AWRm80]|nr:hypothetical protein NEOKW01_1334 [Nematocida sp. AWRm80]
MNDRILGHWDVREKLKDKEDAMAQFNDLVKVCSASSALVKDHIIDKLERTLKDINKNSIKDIDCESIENIKELRLKEVRQQWDTMLPDSSKAIVDNMNNSIHQLLYTSEDIETSTKNRKG